MTNYLVDNSKTRRRDKPEVAVDSRVYLIADPGRIGRVNLIDWGHYRARIRWDSGHVSGVDLADIAPAELAAASAVHDGPAGVGSLAAIPIPAE